MSGRRNFLQQGVLLSVGAFFSDSFDSYAGNCSSNEKIKELARQFSKQTNIKVLTEVNDVQAFGSDFGYIYTSIPEAVFQPKNSEEVQQVVQFLQKEEIPVVIRGEGHSQSGQSLPVPDGVTIDMSGLKKIVALDKKDLLLTCEAGCTWRELVEYGRSERVMPLVLPMFVDLSIGGTISAGGVGSASFRYGISASIVDEMEVVLADGSLVNCSSTKNPEVFAAVLANTGQAGIICSVRLKLREYKNNTITHYLIYDNLKQWLDDQRSLTTTNCEHIQGFFSYNIQGLKNGRPFVLWFYGLQVSFEFANEDEKSLAAAVVQKLNPYKRLGEEIADTAAFSFRFDPRFQAMRQSGAFTLPHPWMEFLLPTEKLEILVPEILNKLPLAMGDGHRLVFINSNHLPENFQIPGAKSVVAFAALPTSVPPPQLKDVLSKLKELHDFVIANGGKRYLSGWLGMMQYADWQKHWDAKFTSWTDQKNKFDPNHLFRSKLFAETFTK